MYRVYFTISLKAMTSFQIHVLEGTSYRFFLNSLPYECLRMSQIIDLKLTFQKIKRSIFNKNQTKFQKINLIIEIKAARDSKRIKLTELKRHAFVHLQLKILSTKKTSFLTGIFDGNFARIPATSSLRLATRKTTSYLV